MWVSCNDCHVVNLNEYVAPYFGVSGCFFTLNWCCVRHAMNVSVVTKRETLDFGICVGGFL